jgi:hypothetical protein
MINPIYVQDLTSCLNHRGEKDREEKEGVSLPSQLERYITTWLVMVTLSPPVAVSTQDF